MGSKSSSVYQSWETNDASQVQGLQAIRGDGNAISVLDGGAVEQAVSLAREGVTSNARTVADMLGTVDSLAGRVIDATMAANDKTMRALTEGAANSTRAVSAAYSSAANSGLQPEKMLLILAALGAAVLLLKR